MAASSANEEEKAAAATKAIATTVMMTTGVDECSAAGGGERMSFEAVPCMFKSRQAEAPLFGLLIRPAASAPSPTKSSQPCANINNNNTSSQPKTTNSKLSPKKANEGECGIVDFNSINASKVTTTRNVDGVVKKQRRHPSSHPSSSSPNSTTTTSSVHIVPAGSACSSGVPSSASDVAAQLKTTFVASLSEPAPSLLFAPSRMVQLQPRGNTGRVMNAATPFLPTTPGVPPILPRPKQQQQHQVKNVLLRAPKLVPIQPRTTASIAALAMSSATTTPTTTNAESLKTVAQRVGAASNSTFEASVHSPSQVVPQLGCSSSAAVKKPTDAALNIATTSSNSSSSFDTNGCCLQSPSSCGLLTVHRQQQSPQKSASPKKCQKQQKTPSKAESKSAKNDPNNNNNTKKSEGRGEKEGSSKLQPQKQKKQQSQKKNQQKQKEKNQQQKTRLSPQLTEAGAMGAAEALLGEDLHAIDLSQLVSSTVITTEDYLPSQSEQPPIYTNMDMYNPGSCQQAPEDALRNQQQQSQQQQHHHNHNFNQQQQQQQYNHRLNRVPAPTPPPTSHPPPPISLTPHSNAATMMMLAGTNIFGGGERHQRLMNFVEQSTINSGIPLHPSVQQPPPHSSTAHFREPSSSISSSSSSYSTSSSSTSTVSYQQGYFSTSSAATTTNGQQPQQQQSQQQIPPLQNNNYAGGGQQPPMSGWHPYLVAHPGGSHISSTPDSGIQSIDGSPPSVYTPPMVSPYASQVRSCESVGLTTGHNSVLACASYNANGGLPPFILATVPTLFTPSASSAPLSCGESFSQFGSSGGSVLAEPSTSQANGSQQQQQLNASRSDENKNLGQQQETGCERGEEENEKGGVMAEEEEGEEEEKEGGSCGEEPDDDFSDMPKLFPATHSAQEEDSGEGEEEGVLPPSQKNSGRSGAVQKEERAAVPLATNASANTFVVPPQPSSNVPHALSSSSPSATVLLLQPSLDNGQNPATQQQMMTQSTSCAVEAAAVRQPLFYQGMTLQELAECISSSMAPEQLAQLTSLIQSKAINTRGETPTKSREEERREVVAIPETVKESKELPQKDKRSSSTKNDLDDDICDANTSHHSEQKIGSKEEEKTSPRNSSSPSPPSATFSEHLHSPPYQPNTPPRPKKRKAGGESRPKEPEIGSGTDSPLCSPKMHTNAVVAAPQKYGLPSSSLFTPNHWDNNLERPFPESSSLLLAQKGQQQEEIPPSTSSSITSSSITSTSSFQVNRIGEERNEQRQNVHQLAFYRRQVHVQLRRKLEAFIERVCRQLEDTHLHIQRQNKVFGSWRPPPPFQRVDWQRVQQRLLFVVEEEKTRRRREWRRKMRREEGKLKEKEKRKEEEEEEEREEEQRQQQQQKQQQKEQQQKELDSHIDSGIVRGRKRKRQSKHFDTD